MAARVLIIGGGAAGFFAAIRAAELLGPDQVVICEAGGKVLKKVRISGGGRCNVTHSCFEPRELIKHYPRGAKELLGVFSRFQPQDTIDWFEARGLSLKTEADGRMFPTTNSSESVIHCLESSAQAAGVALWLNAPVVKIEVLPESQEPEAARFRVHFSQDRREEFRSVLIATGSSPEGHRLAASLGHQITPLAPSLFTFKIQDNQLTALSGLSLPKVELDLEANGKHFSAKGPWLVTHWGLSGPAVLRISAFAALDLQMSQYQGKLEANLLPDSNREELRRRLEENRARMPQRLVRNETIAPLPQRLWAYILDRAGVNEGKSWAELSRTEMEGLENALFRLEFFVKGKGEFKEEFVTCGGVERKEIDWKRMESRLQPGLFFAGEVIDVDGVTGGFNFQNAWSGGFLAGTAMAEA